MIPTCKVPWYDSITHTQMAIDTLTTRLAFSLIVALGIGVGLLLTYNFLSTQKDQLVREYVDAAAFTMVGALIGSRIFYVAINWPYFQQNLIEIITLWLGGFSWVGASAGTLLAIFLIAHRRGVPFGSLMDSLLPVFCTTTISIWLGCWWVGAVYGHLSDVWWALPAMDEWGLVARRLPVPLIAMISTLAIHALVDYAVIRRGITLPGIAACLELSGFSLTILLLIPLRADSMISAFKISGVSLEAWAAIFFLFFFMVLGAYFHFK